MATSIQVGARELKLRLGKYLAQVRQGRTLVITDRGRPIAELRPLRSAADETEAAWESLYAQGTVTRPTRRLRRMQPLRAPGVTLSDLVIQEREDRV